MQTFNNSLFNMNFFIFSLPPLKVPKFWIEKIELSQFLIHWKYYPIFMEISEYGILLVY